MTVRRLTQTLSLALFLVALVCAPAPFLGLWPADGFLRMDPIVGLGTLVADRHVAPLLWIAGLIVVVSLVLGRFFCAYLCPMGISIDMGDHLLRSRRRSSRLPAGNDAGRMPSRRLKYYVLIFILGAGCLGVSPVAPSNGVTQTCIWQSKNVVAASPQAGSPAMRNFI